MVGLNRRPERLVGKRLEVGEGGEEAEEERDEELLNVKVGLRVKLCLYVFSDKNVGMKGRERRRRKIKGEVLEKKEEEKQGGRYRRNGRRKKMLFYKKEEVCGGVGFILTFASICFKSHFYLV